MPIATRNTQLEVLPRPTGEHAVGRMSMDVADVARLDVYAADSSAHRELVLFVWYPAADPVGDRRAELMPEAWTPIADQLGLDTDGVLTHAWVDAPVAEPPERRPVLLMSPSGFSPLLLSAIAEELASHGYVVVGVAHTHESAVTAFADGRRVPMNPAALAGALEPQHGAPAEGFARRAAVCDYKAADLRSVADHLARLAPNAAGLTSGHLDLDRLGAFGHSFGGNAALEWCRRDERCRAAANLDGAVWTAVGRVGLPRPALQVLADHPEFDMSGDDAVRAGIASDAVWHDAERALAVDGWRAVDRLARPGRTVRIAGAGHMSFMDIPFLPLRPGSPVSGWSAAITIEPTRMWQITTELLRDFFDRYLCAAIDDH